MTTTSAAHYVVDGSNIATEGRSRPSLEQLQEAVTTFMADHPEAMITVVVDATFGRLVGRSVGQLGRSVVGRCSIFET